MTHIGLGTAAIGRPQYINIRQEENPTSIFDKEAFKRKGWGVLEEAYALGIRYFDTAPGYGLAEELVLEWAKDKKDPTIEIATKWGYTYTANFDPNAEVHEVKEHSLKKLNEQWKTSEALLPYLTTYQIHSATFDSGVLENIEVHKRLNELKQEHGLLIGLSSSGENQVEILKKALEVEVESEPLFQVFQVTYNILDQSIGVIGDQLSQGKNRLIIKEALANGRVFPNNSYPHYHELYTTLESMANKYGVGIDAITLRFCVETLAPYAVLSGASTKEQLNENVAATSFEFDYEDLVILKSFLISPEAYWKERKELAWN